MADDTYQKFGELRGRFGRYHSKVRRARRLYARDFENDVLPAGARARGFRAVIPMTARRSIDEAVDHVLYHPKVRVPVRPTEGKALTEQEIAEKKRKALTAWWRQIGQRFNTIGDARKWMFLDGKIVVKQTIRWDLIPDKDDPKYRDKIKKLGRYEFLWHHEILNAEWVYEDPGDHRNPGYVFVAYSLLAEQAKKKFPQQGTETPKWHDKPDYSKVNYLEYWSEPTWNDDGTWEPGRFKQYIEGDLVHDDENPYPYIPIAIEDSGYGLNHAGIEIEDKFVGLLDHAESVIIAQARQWTAMEAVAELTAFNPIEARNMSDDKVASLVVGPGEVWQLEGNPQVDANAEQVILTKWPDIPLTVMQMIGLTDREVNSALKSDTLGGTPQKGVDTATEADQNVRNSAAKLSSPVAGLERLAVKLSRWMLMDIELVLEAPVTLYGTGSNDPAEITLTPRDINGYYDCFLELRTTDEMSMDATRAKLWADLYNIIPILSAFTAVEAGGISDDPLAEMLRRAGEDVFNSEEFRQIRIATGAESFGELATYIKQLIDQTNGTGGGGGGPTVPGAPSPSQLAGPPEVINPLDPTQATINNAYDARDVNQAGAAFEGGGAGAI